MAILIYAELLSNIRQVSIGCSLPSPADANTAARISADGSCLLVRHHGNEASLRLPGRVAAPSTLPLASSKATSLSWRLPLALSYTTNVPWSVDSQAIPWCAQDLEPEGSVCCRACQTTVILLGTVKIWKDLPSENWAEMMEFWHCHKPHNHGHHDDKSLSTRGYGANSQISGQAGVGFVDITTFLFAKADCLGSSLTRSSQSTKLGLILADGQDSNLGDEPNGSTVQSQSLYCSNCQSEIGVTKEQTTISLFKWQLAIGNPANSGPRTQPTLANCVSSILLATLARSGCSKSIMMPLAATTGTSFQQGQIGQPSGLLHIWLFNGNITFSATKGDDSRLACPAVKVLYRMVEQDEANKMLDSMSSVVQDITLPSSAIDDLFELLKQSNEYLPPNDRNFKEWTVGLLKKWDGDGG